MIELAIIYISMLVFQIYITATKSIFYIIGIIITVIPLILLLVCYKFDSEKFDWIIDFIVDYKLISISFLPTIFCVYKIYLVPVLDAIVQKFM